MASRIETLDFVKVMLGVQTTCGLLERMPDVRHFEWMKSEKKNIDQPNTACTTSAYTIRIIRIEFPTSLR